MSQGIGLTAVQSERGEGAPVSELIGMPVRNTALLALVSAVMLVIWSVVLGSIAALRRGRPTDTLIQSVTLLWLALPEFVLGSILIILFAFVWPILPAVTFDVTLEGLVLPMLALLLGSVASTARLIRVGMLQVLESNYVVCARLRGLPEHRVIGRYVLPNSIAPSLQALAMIMSSFVGGVVVVEYLFGYPGLGTGFVSAVEGRDYPVVQAYAVLLAGFYIVVNLAADLIQVATNPRLRASVTKRT